MAKRIFTFELDGKQVLGFDTGMDAQAFAQAKMAQFITQTGSIVYPEGRIETWQAEGVTEIAGESGEGTMVIQGPFFPGECLDSVLRDSGRREESLDAVRFWFQALRSRQSREESGGYFPGSASIAGAGGVLIVTQSEKNFPRGTILFPPERLVRRCIEAGGHKEAAAAQQWYHPDLQGEDETAFSAGIMLYAVFAGALPFVRDDGDTIRQDMREGVCMPLELAVPGIDANLAKLIGDALLPIKKITEGKKRPSPSDIADFIGNPGVGISKWFRELSGPELAKIEHEREQYKKARGLVVKTRRFVIRNTTIITACAAALLALGLGVGSYVKSFQSRPNTVGMTPAQVAETYYGAFDTMDHALMEACVINKAGKGDIDMVTNLFVITKVRQAYESTLPSISPQDWLDAGSPETDITIFGVTSLRLAVIEGDESSGEVSLRADYTLWMPGSMIEETEELTPEELMSENPPIIPPARLSYTDELTISFHKNAWRISAIDRKAEY